MVIIRPEEEQHAVGIRKVEELAFRRPAEADLCERLTQRGAVTLSLVALDEGAVVGHVLFSAVTIRPNEQPAQAGFAAVGMGPVAVLPAQQRKGIGSRLIRAGIEEIRQQGADALVVLGDPHYYARFGFEPGQHYGIRFEDLNVPAEDFMVMELRQGALEGHSGLAFYEPEFKEV